MSSESSDKTVRFICCEHRYHKAEPPKFDLEGFLVCPTHGHRRYGWRSPRRVQALAYPQVDPAKPVYVNVPKWGETDLQRDRFIVGELFPLVTDLSIVAEEESEVNRTFVLTPEEMEALGK